MSNYPSSLTDPEWDILESYLPPPPTTLRGRPVENSKRSILYGILYIIRSSGAWKLMSNDLPHWNAAMMSKGSRFYRDDGSWSAPSAGSFNRED